MLLSSVLHPECIQIGSGASNKSEVLEEIARLAAKSEALANCGEQEIRDALAAREKIGSTGFGNGIAIPHCTLEKAGVFTVGILLEPKGIDFAALDGKKVSVFFFILGPPGERDQHIQLLSTVSKLLRQKGILSNLRKAGDSAEVQKIIEENPEREASSLQGQTSGPRCLFHVFIQREDMFDEILEVFSASVQGSVAVLENKSAGSYLHRIPLFAAYWTDQPSSYSRIILAVVDKGLCNDIIRRINLVVDNYPHHTQRADVDEATYAEHNISVVLPPFFGAAAAAADRLGVHHGTMHPKLWLLEYAGEGEGAAPGAGAGELLRVVISSANLGRYDAKINNQFWACDFRRPGAALQAMGAKELRRELTERGEDCRGCEVSEARDIFRVQHDNCQGHVVNLLNQLR